MGSSPAPARNERPVPSMAVISTMLSTVRPAEIACGPQELLPIMPAMVARFFVEGSGPKVSPCGFPAFCSSLMSTPGSTRAVFATGSMSRMRLRWREKSMTIPVPIELPA
jgi:hypothetical protein